jgi:hypothetical protein
MPQLAPSALAASAAGWRPRIPFHKHCGLDLLFSAQCHAMLANRQAFSLQAETPIKPKGMLRKQVAPTP